jgi:hypothetical protein
MENRRILIVELSRSAKCAFGVAAAVAMLAGCSGGGNGVGSQLAPTSDSSSVRSRSTSVLRPGVALLHGASIASHGSHFVHPNPCCNKILFVSDSGNNTVQLFNYPSGALLGPLTPPPGGFQEPQGECVDSPNPQHVFITNTLTSTVLEYKHTGNLVMQLADPGQYPVSCAYRSTGPNSGVLAVANIFATSGAPGSVSVYTHTGNTWSAPVTYAPPGFSEVYFLSYQNTTLYLDGLFSGTFFAYASMLPGGQFTNIPLVGATVNYPGNVQAFTNYIAVGDQLPAAGSPNIYHVLPSGQVIGSTTIPGSGDIVQFFRKGPRVVAPDVVNATANIYAYPAGSPLLAPIGSPLVQPIGSAVSHQ